VLEYAHDTYVYNDINVIKSVEKISDIQDKTFSYTVTQSI